MWDLAAQHREYTTTFESCTQTWETLDRTTPARSLLCTHLSLHRNTFLKDPECTLSRNFHNRGSFHTSEQHRAGLEIMTLMEKQRDLETILIQDKKRLKHQPY